MIATLHANTTTPWPLGEGTVHVWRFACEQDPGPLVAVLSDDELGTARRFKFREHHDRYIVQHAMMRCLLARYLDRAPEAITIARRARGKPFQPHDPGLEFNLSHADDVALLAVTRGHELGVDLERFAARLDPDELAPIVLAPDEHVGSGDRRAFLRIWCRKEACLKAVGVGLVDDLTSVSVANDRTAVRGTTVIVRDLFVSTTHAAALATLVPVLDVLPTPLEDFVTS